MSSWYEAMSTTWCFTNLLVLIALFQYMTPAVSMELTYCSSLNTGSDFDDVFTDFQSNGACQKTCIAKYAFAIMQGKSCWCSNVAPGNTVSIDRCDDKCPGYPDDHCGSLSRNLYAYILLNTKPTSTMGGSSSETSSTESTSSTSQPPSTTTDAGGQVVTVTVPDNQGSHSNTSGSSLSGGGIAGVVIGVLAGVGLIVGAAVWFFMRRRRNDDDQSFTNSQYERPVPPPNFQGTFPQMRHNNHIPAGNVYGANSERGNRLSVPAFTDNRMNQQAEIYPNGGRNSNVSLQDNQDYSRPVLRLTNPDPE